MADGLNDARAMRIAEILTDYQAIQTQISSYRSYMQQSDNTAGFAVLRQVLTESERLLAIPFAGPDISIPTSPGEGTKKQLQRILLDAATRRFRAMRLFQRGAAAVRWIQRRSQASHTGGNNGAVLGQIDNALRTEIIAVTDSKVFSELSQRDTANGHWSGEMPTLQQIQKAIETQG